MINANMTRLTYFAASTHYFLSYSAKVNVVNEYLFLRPCRNLGVSLF